MIEIEKLKYVSLMVCYTLKGDEMMKNYFLTGDIHAGKSTLINGVLEAFSGKICGFRTLRSFSGGTLEGFYMDSVQKNLLPIQDSFIGKCVDGKHWEAVTSTFDELGVRILKDSLVKKPDLIIMDELGFFEAKAFSFQDMVKAVLDSDIPVLGVIKEKRTTFLEQIRSRNDIMIFTVTRDNHYEIFKLICENLNINPLLSKDYIKLLNMGKE